MNLTAAERQRIANSAPPQPIDPPSFIGMSANEIKHYSMARAMRDIATGDWKKGTFESACSDSIIGRRGTACHHQDAFLVPFEIQHRALTVGIGAQGGYTVGTEILSFIDLLRNRAVLFRMGAVPMGGLRGNASVPKLTGGTTGFWLGAETTQFSQKEQTLSQLNLTPKNVGGYTELSRQLLIQSPDFAEPLAMYDLAGSTALALDLGGITGNSAAGQPTGIINVPGINTVLPATPPSYVLADMNKLQTNAIAANSNGDTFGVVTTGAIAKKWKETQQFAGSSTTLWTGSLFDTDDVCGERGMTSTQVPSGTVIAGNWGDIVVASWGDLEIAVNQFANFQSGVIGVRCFLTCDIGIRYPGVWSVSTGIS